jgi:sulfatase modifying factor 1
MTASRDAGDFVTSCCGAVTRRREDEPAFDEDAAVVISSGLPVTTLRTLPGGVFTMGSAEQRYPADHEGPPRRVVVAGFRITAHAVSNDQFAAFVAATGYFTTAEREGWSFVFGGLLPDDFPPTCAVAAAPWWRQVPGASWHRPEGGTSNLDGRGGHPVVHVSWLDARAKRNGSTRRAAGSRWPAIPGVTN